MSTESIIATSKRVRTQENIALERDPQERLEYNHQRAVLGLQLEQYLDTTDDPRLADFAATHDMNLLTPELYRINEYIIEQYTKDKMSAQNSVQSLMKRSEQQYGTPNEIHRVLFEARVGKGNKPDGQVDIEVQGPLIIVRCENSNDYKRLAGTKDSSSGTFHTKFSLAISNTPDNFSADSLVPPPIPELLNPTVILIDKNSTLPESEVVKHERQHYINARLYLDNVQKQPGISKEILAKASLKDELVAMLRGGTSAEDIRYFFTNSDSPYDWMTDEKTGDANLLVIRQEILQAMSDTKSLFGTSLGRDMLTHHLLYVPLERVAQEITLLGQYYKERQVRAKQDIAALGVNDTLKPYPPHLISVEFRPQAQEVAEKYEAYKETLSQETVLLEELTFIADADTKQSILSTIQMKRQDYFVSRDTFIQASGLPEHIDLVQAKLPPPLPGTRR